MKIATYRLHDGSDLMVTYEDKGACVVCGLPVISASMGGTVICPWCDCGVYRDGTRQMTFDRAKIKREACNRLGWATEAKAQLIPLNNKRPLVLNNKKRF